MATENVDIDDSLYSRQRYVLGDSAMQRMARSNVLLYGLGGLGVEIAKNIVLAGIKSLTLQDPQSASYMDLATQFFIREDDVKSGRNRAEVSQPLLSQLNPYVSVKSTTQPLTEDCDLKCLKEYQCIILTGASLALQLRIDHFCRTQNPPIKFISADVYGVFCSVFCDFGDHFEVVDQNGEEPVEVFVANITKANPGIVTCLENQMHGLESGAYVTFKEVEGMTSLNNTTHQVKVLSPYAFSICDTTSSQYKPYITGGRCIEVKQSATVTFESLEAQLTNPSILISDLSKMESPASIHLGLYALHKYMEKHKTLPRVRHKGDAEELLKLAKSLNSTLINKVVSIDNELLTHLAFTAQGCFAPLTAAVGGIVAQEALKSLTGKFTPLNQWFYLDAQELLSECHKENDECFQPRQDRYDALRICVGDRVCQQLNSLKLFMVGCGAIGCEMMKNYALLGIGSSQHGLITITDNDLIEKSNLNRQFLFRSHHIQQPKSTTAAQSVLDINPTLHIEPQQYRVCPQTEHEVYNDEFFARQDLIVNALDNVEARRYVDSRCVTNQRALLESGTMGAKGHVQVIIPHLTESYASQQDPPDKDVPYCTLKSFPAVIEHTIQWARDKFESLFSQKPAAFTKFWQTNGSPETALQKFSEGSQLEGGLQALKMLKQQPHKWEDCIVLARTKFEKYFNHKAKNLVYAFPLDTRLKDGSMFWQSPKRPPVPIDFDITNQMHTNFILSLAKLLAYVWGVAVTCTDTHYIVKILEKTDVPPFVPSSKKIETDESAEKPREDEEENFTSDDIMYCCKTLSKLIKDGNAKQESLSLHPVTFEKDNDDNGHIDFITSAANIRATMYNIDNADRLKIKKIAGRIVPAIATTTAAVAGLVTMELIKIVKKSPLEHYKNCFLNLALPSVIFSEPGQAEKTQIHTDLSFTLWDKWQVKGNKSYTLKEFLKYFKTTYGLEATMVVHGVKMVYVPIMPMHNKRLPQTMIKLLKPTPKQEYVDLTVAFESSQGEDVPGPPVRYYFGGK
ncbi:ubiquitin-like modifier-activating enzyme 6 [Saccoglossus kowalevskii]|uniref:Ubiquitin-like modifier-activating enzyme 6-like n=1 Tax=Saccoglossus kowalevskii TaxID=10224 RepID=A0ABM0GNA5_SACKO|nr:PREDICTED: ubiquitin-like modifier-activating enzyme 6-like [Saccoglossus kowalevskii]